MTLTFLGMMQMIHLPLTSDSFGPSETLHPKDGSLFSLYYSDLNYDVVIHFLIDLTE